MATTLPILLRINFSARICRSLSSEDTKPSPAMASVSYLPSANDPWGRLKASTITFFTPRCRSEEHTSELQSRENLVCRLLLEKKKRNQEPTSVAAAIGRFDG